MTATAAQAARRIPLGALAHRLDLVGRRGEGQHRVRPLTTSAGRHLQLRLLLQLQLLPVTRFPPFLPLPAATAVAAATATISSSAAAAVIVVLGLLVRASAAILAAPGRRRRRRRRCRPRCRCGRGRGRGCDGDATTRAIL